jgi:bifunctional non-homologous end joining protein LigD
MASGKLSEYSAKRRFDATPEPPAVVADRAGPLLFVVQKHAASQLHYDLRLECDGVLLSWAVPKGLSLDISQKRFAMQTEDHPYEYASFEGIIPKGQYGAGEMIVWDCGVYSPDEGGLAFHDRQEAQRRVREDLAAGKLGFQLRGTKLKGSFALVKMKEAGQWLIIKHKDRYGSASDILERDRSALTDLAIDDVKVVPVKRLPAAKLVPSGAPRALPAKLEPMLAEIGDKPQRREGWQWEPKLDGYRVLAIVGADGAVRLRSRRGLDYTAHFPNLVGEIAAQGVPGSVIDGEVVAFRADGKPSFAALQERAQLKAAADIAAADRNLPAAFVAFDLPFFAGVDLRGFEWRDRRRYLTQCVLPSASLQVVHAHDDGAALMAAALANGFEGVMGKRVDAKYESGKRSNAWLKVKPTQSEEFVIGGYMKGRNSRAALGSLLIGRRRGRKLEYASHVGSGFDDRTLAALMKRLDPLVCEACPFTEVPELNGPTVWVKPKIVAEVQFHGWTEDGRLRAPVFLRLRDDIPPPLGGGGGRLIDDILAQLDSEKKELDLAVGPHRIKLTNLDRVYWPENKVLRQRAMTKRDLLRYLAKVSPYMLPHLADRPLTMIRMPDGIRGQRFFQKHWEQARPEFVETVTVWSGHKEGTHEYLLCNNLPSLLWLAQSGTLEYHIWHSRAKLGADTKVKGTNYGSEAEMDASILNYPDYVVIDIDPYIYSGLEAKGAEPELNTVAFEKGKEVAFRVRELLNTMSLEPVVKTSGKTGLHVFLPIKRALDFEAARHVSELLGRHLVKLDPEGVTVEWSIPKRTGKIFMDYNMNVRGKTLNVAYSPRGEAGAPVSMPLTWEELADAHPLDFRMENAPQRLAKTGDRWGDILDRKQDLARMVKGAKVAKGAKG